MDADAEVSALAAFINSTSASAMPEGAAASSQAHHYQSNDNGDARRRHLQLQAQAEQSSAARPLSRGSPAQGGFLRPHEMQLGASSNPHSMFGASQQQQQPQRPYYTPGQSPFVVPSGQPQSSQPRLVRGSDLPAQPYGGRGSPVQAPDPRSQSPYGNGTASPVGGNRPAKRPRTDEDTGGAGNLIAVPQGSPNAFFPAYPEIPGSQSTAPLSLPPNFDPNWTVLVQRFASLHPGVPPQTVINLLQQFHGDARAVEHRLSAMRGGQANVVHNGQQWQSQPQQGYPYAQHPQYRNGAHMASAPFMPPQQQRYAAPGQQSGAAYPFAYNPHAQNPRVYQHRPPAPGSIAAQQYALQQLQQQAGPRKLIKRNLSDEEDEEDDHSGDEFANEADAAEKEATALEFFNTCKEHELPDMTCASECASSLIRSACTAVQAQIVYGLRPFESVDDLRAKMRKAKGVSATLFDNFVDIIRAYDQVDRVFAQCASVGSKLSQTMRIWTGVPLLPRRAGSPSKSTAGTPDESRAGSPDIDPGVHLVSLDEAALQQSRQSDAPAEVKAAFTDYIAEQPKALPETVTLKSYQLLGVNWLNLLYREGHSCILADEMGLGKTIQVIAFIAHLKEKQVKGPHLVVVPSSTLDNWLREFSIFAPSLEVASYYGTQNERAEIRDHVRRNKDLDVLVTTYNMASGSSEDRKFLRKLGFKTCTYDEGHQLKNAQSKKYKDLMVRDEDIALLRPRQELQVPWRLLLTGTPLQNNLTELISLLSFILPRIFFAADENFRAIFKVPAQGHAHQLSQKRIEAAKRIMTPFVLRRKKLQVLTDLPAKHERIEFCELSTEQKGIYRDAMLRSKKVLMSATADEDPDLILDIADGLGEEGSKKKRGAKKGTLKPAETSSSNVLMDLRKAANHPMLFRRIYDDKKLREMAADCLKQPQFSQSRLDLVIEDMQVMTDYELHRFVKPYQYLAKHALQDEEWMRSGKVEALKRIVPPALQKGDRVLLFSQFTQVLDILEAVLTTMGIRYLKLTGQTNVSERQMIVDMFYDDTDIGVFLLSTRAGGLGLNLAAANVVILWDQDFNPHNDKQAEDRAWRIGQTKDVQVIRLITKGTIEEDMLALAQTKLALDKQVSLADDELTRALAGGLGEPTVASTEASSKAGSGASTPAILEVQETLVDKKVKSTLLSRLRQQLADEPDDPSRPGSPAEA